MRSQTPDVISETGDGNLQSQIWNQVMTQTIVNSNFLQSIMILSPISIPKSWVQVSSHPDPDIELGWGSGTLHSPFKQNLRIYVIQANICFTVDVNFIQFSVNSTLYNTCLDSGYGLQSSSECWTNLVILVTLSWPGVRREGGRGQCNVWTKCVHSMPPWSEWQWKFPSWTHFFWSGSQVDRWIKML